MIEIVPKRSIFGKISGLRLKIGGKTVEGVKSLEWNGEELIIRLYPQDLKLGRRVIRKENIDCLL